jgi:GABA(A) receptor-associated protein
MKGDFKKQNTLEKRKNESQTIVKKYPGRIPIIVEKYHDCELPDIDKIKYLVPKDMTISQFMFIMRKRIKLESSQSLFVTVNSILVSSNAKICEIYDDNKDEDGFLYVVYTSENTFG